MKNLKKPLKVLIIAGIALDVAITVFLFVVSIIMLAKTAGKSANEIQNATGFIGYLQNHPLVYGLAFVVPLFVLLAGNIIGLVIYVKRTSENKPVQVNDLSDEQKEALRQELLKELQGGNEEKE